MAEELSIEGLVVLAIAGVFATIINVIAGGGGMIVLPALMALGLPVDIANGTYRLGVVTQSISGTTALRGHTNVEARPLVPIMIPMVLGAALGAALATSIPRELLKPIVLTTMIAMAGLIAFRKQTLVAEEGDPKAPSEAPWSYVGLFFSGFYGGFIQAGVGFLILAVLVGTLRYDFVSANAIKLLTTLVFGTVAFGIFVWAGHVAWTPAIVLAASSIVGARLGVKVMLKVPVGGLRWFVFLCVVATCIAAWLR
ncbi:MAG: sulfite exporter TauE/SafE family protein [Polyangiales bacterium]